MKQDSALKVLAYKLMLTIPDKWYLSMKFYKNFGRLPDWNNPKTFNEKLQWLKVNNRRPEYPMMVDKYEAKKYISDVLGAEYVIPTLGIWNNAEDIEFDQLPDKFVLKATHDSGRVVICKDKAFLDKEWAREEMRKSLKRDFYAVTREWPYKNVKRRIIAEQYIDNNGQDLQDFKIHCFNGEPKFILICSDRFSGSGLTEDFYDTEWKKLDMKRPSHPTSDVIIPKPEHLEKMLELAKIVSAGHPFLRVDFYEASGRILFGELTLFPASGTEHFEPEEWDTTLGEWLKL